MYYKDICKILGIYLFGLTIAMLLPFCLAVYYEYFADTSYHLQPHTTRAFFFSIALCALFGGASYWYGRQSTARLYRREGLIAVVLIWFLTPVFAGLPFYLSQTLTNPFQAFFEATSGFTTTGATTMQAKKFDETGKEIPIEKEFCGMHTTVYTYFGTIDPVRDKESGKILFEGIEAVSKALLFWRSLTQWLGGMGIIVLFVAVFPALGVGGKMLFQAEIPGPVKESLTPRIKETALHLWMIYLGLSFLEVVALMVTNENIGLYDALTITFSTVSTGGFSTKNASIGAFNHPQTEWVVFLFMALAAINFSLYFFALRGKFYRLYEPEFFLFLILLFLGCIFASWFLFFGTRHVFLSDAIRFAAFQITSAMTTTGFTTANYEIWPYTVQVLMLLFMFVGGMSCSTAGGIKVIRQYMLFKIAQYKVESLFRPETVRRFKIGEREVDQGIALTTLVYFLLVVSISAFSTFFFVMDGIDPETSLSLVTLMINNIGIGFRMASPQESFAFLSNTGLVFSSLLMVFGRLEFFAVLAVMVPAFWKQDE